MQQILFGRILHALLALGLGCGVAFADHYYVDAANGDDTNTGTSALEAWRTLTHARGSIPGTGHTLHIAPGLYDPSHGENYPLDIIGLTVVGDAGSAATILDAGGDFAVLSAQLDGVAELVGVTLRNAGNGFQNYQQDDGWTDVTLRDVRIVDMDVGFLGDGWGVGLGSTYVARLEDVRIEDCGTGVRITNQGHHSTTSVAIVDSLVTGCTLGLSLRCGGPGSGHGFEVRRCRVEGNGAGALLVGDDWVSWGGWFTDSVIALNATYGVETRAETGGGVTVARSTVAHNGGAGVRTLPPTTAVLASAIVYGNGDDLAGTFQASFSNIGDGDLAGSSGNIAADPLFLDPASGDWRLHFGSPCVDAGSPDVPAGALDVAGHPRPLDGDLDARPRTDMGAHELAPLTSGAARVGLPLAFELWGPPGATSVLFGHRGPPLSEPLALPIGALYLPRATAVELGAGQAAPGPPGGLDLPLPADPGLVGTTLSFQVLTGTPHAAPTRALSNVVVVVVQP